MNSTAQVALWKAAQPKGTAIWPNGAVAQLSFDFEVYPEITGLWPLKPNMTAATTEIRRLNASCTQTLGELRVGNVTLEHGAAYALEVMAMFDWAGALVSSKQ